jgi:hypothetical protein
MSFETETPRQYAERMANIFGKRRPNGVRLRGSKGGTHFHEYEIRLIDNFQRCKSHYKKLLVEDEPKVREHLARQERVIYRLAHSFDIDSAPDWKENGGYHDFIPWPDQAESYYTEGLADRIFVTEYHELPYLLDFQYYNHVIAEKFSKVKYLQMLRFNVRHSLAEMVVKVENRNLEFLDDWIYRHVSGLSLDGQKEFHWYPEAFEWREKIGSPPSEDSVAEVLREERPNGGVNETSQLKKRKDFKPTVKESILKYSCTFEQLSAYFNVLKAQNPAKAAQMLNDEAVDWIVGYYFRTEGRCTEDNMPEFELNLSREELKYFIYRYTEDISPLKRGTDASSKDEVCKILTQCFPYMFDMKPEVLATRLKRDTDGFRNTATQIIDEAIKKHKAQTDHSAPSKSGRKRVKKSANDSGRS